MTADYDAQTGEVFSFVSATEPAFAKQQLRPKMPPEIAKAVLAVMMRITPLSKDAENKFQKYHYVSVDQFYDLVGRLMADAGLFVVAFEKTMDVSKQSTTDDYGKSKESVWLSATYELFLYHSSGAEFGPVERSIKVPASGAQSYASALSFVEKYFLRGLFKIPTGDIDVDGEEKRALPRDDALCSKDQTLELQTLLNDTNTTAAAFCEFYKIAGLSDLPARRYKEAIDFLTLKLRRAVSAKETTK